MFKKNQVSAVNMAVDAKMKKSCIAAYSSYQQFLAKKKEAAEREREDELRTSVFLLKREKAKRITKLVRFKNKNKLINRESVKKKAK